MLVPAGALLELIDSTATLLEEAGEAAAGEQLRRVVNAFLRSQQALGPLEGGMLASRPADTEALPLGRREPLSGRRLPNRPWYGARRMR